MPIDLSSTLLLVPVRERPEIECVLALLQTQRLHPELQVGFLPGQADIRLVRNHLADFFLESKKQHLIMVDDDIYFSTSDFNYLVESEHHAVCLSFAKRDTSAAPVHFGLACCRVDRCVFEGLKPLCGSYTEPEKPRTQWDFFEQGPGVLKSRDDRQWCSESFCFWSRIEEAGFEIDFKADTDIIHYGKIGFKLKVKIGL
jgi:hypothetical protein